MLDLDKDAQPKEKHTRTSQIRHGDQLADLIDEASLVLGVDKSVFLRNAISKEAKQILERSKSHQLRALDADLFAKALETPPVPTAKALKAKQQYLARVKNAE